jgi:hypothetical protein
MQKIASRDPLQEDWTSPTTQNSMCNVNGDNMLNYNGIGNSDLSWFEDMNLVSWILPRVDFLPQMDGSSAMQQ